MIYQNISQQDHVKLKQILDLTSHNIENGGVEDVIGNMEPDQLMMICENNVPASVLRNCFDFWSKLNIITKNKFLRYFNNWTGKNIKKTTIKSKDLWTFSEKQLEEYRNYIELDQADLWDNEAETIHQQCVQNDVEPENNINEYNLVTQNPEEYWLNSTLVYRTYTILKDELDEQWTDSIILLQCETAQMISQSAENNFNHYLSRSVDLFLKNNEKWKEKKGIWVTVNDCGSLGKKGMHWVTLGIHLIKKIKPRITRRTRSSSRPLPEFEEFKLYLFDPLHQPFHKSRYPQAFKRIQKWILKPFNEWMKALIKKEKVRSEKPINFEKKFTQIKFNPSQTNGYDCGLYCSVALKHFQSFVENYDVTDTKLRKMKTQITNGVSATELKAKRQDITKQIMDCKEAVDSASNAQTRKSMILSSASDWEEQNHQQQEQDQEDDDDDDDDQVDIIINNALEKEQRSQGKTTASVFVPQTGSFSVPSQSVVVSENLDAEMKDKEDEIANESNQSNNNNNNNKNKKNNNENENEQEKDEDHDDDETENSNGTEDEDEEEKDEDHDDVMKQKDKEKEKKNENANANETQDEEEVNDQEEDDDEQKQQSCLGNSNISQRGSNSGASQKKDVQRARHKRKRARAPSKANVVVDPQPLSKKRKLNNKKKKNANANANVNANANKLDKTKQTKKK